MGKKTAKFALPTWQAEYLRLLPEDDQSVQIVQANLARIADRLRPQHAKTPKRVLLSDHKELIFGVYPNVREEMVFVISSGLIKRLDSEDKIAAGLDHEIEHWEITGKSGKNQQNSKAEESRADLVTPQHLHDAGYDAREVLGLAGILAAEEAKEKINPWNRILGDVHPFAGFREANLRLVVAGIDQRVGGLHRPSTPMNKGLLAAAEMARHASFIETHRARIGAEQLSPAQQLRAIQDLLPDLGKNHRARHKEAANWLRDLIRNAPPDDAAIVSARNSLLMALPSQPFFLRSAYNIMAPVRAEDNRILAVGPLSPLNDAFETFVKAASPKAASEAAATIISTLEHIGWPDVNLSGIAWNNFELPPWKEMQRAIKEDGEYIPPYQRHVTWGLQNPEIFKALLVMGVIHPTILRRVDQKFLERWKIYLDDTQSFMTTPVLPHHKYNDLRFNHQGNIIALKPLDGFMFGRTYNDALPRNDSDFSNGGLGSNEEKKNKGNNKSSPSISLPTLSSKPRTASFETTRSFALPQEYEEFFVAVATKIIVDAHPEGASYPQRKAADSQDKSRPDFDSKFTIQDSEAWETKHDGEIITQYGEAQIKQESAAGQSLAAHMDALRAKDPAAFRRIVRRILYGQAYETASIPQSQEEIDSQRDRYSLDGYVFHNLGIGQQYVLVAQGTFTRWLFSLPDEILSLHEKSFLIPKFGDKGGLPLSSAWWEKFIGRKLPQTYEEWLDFLDHVKGCAPLLHDDETFQDVMQTNYARLMLKAEPTDVQLISTFGAYPKLVADAHYMTTHHLEGTTSEYLTRRAGAIKAWPQDVRLIAKFYTALEEYGLFSNEEQRLQLIEIITKKIQKRKTPVDVIAATEVLLLGDRQPKDLKFLQQVQTLWATAVAAQYGIDDGSRAYRARIMPVMQRIEKQATMHMRWRLLGDLADRVEAQEALAKICSKITATIPETHNQLQPYNTPIIFSEAIAEIVITHPEHVPYITAYLSSPLSRPNLRTFTEQCMDDMIAAASAISALAGIGKQYYDWTPEQRESYATIFHQSFWAASLPERGMFMNILLFPPDPNNKITHAKQLEKASNILFASLFKSGDVHSQDAKLILREFLHVIPEYKRGAFIALIMAAAEPGQKNSGSSLGIVAEILYNWNPATRKLAQAIKHFPGSPPDVRLAFKDATSMAAPGFRWDQWREYTRTVPQELQRRVKHLSALKGAASYALGIEAHNQDGTHTLFSIQREHAENQAAEGFRELEQLNARLAEHKTGRIPAIAAFLVDRIAEAKNSSRYETDKDYGALQSIEAARIFNPLDIRYNGKSYDFKNARWINYGAEFSEQDLMPGDHFMDLPEDTSEQKQSKDDHAVVHTTACFFMMLSGDFLDDDRHSAQERIDGNSHGLFDNCRMLLEKPSEADKKILADVIARGIGSAIADLTSAEGCSAEKIVALFLDSLNAAKDEYSSSKSYLMRIERSLLAQNDYLERLQGNQIVQILAAIAATGKIDPVIAGQLRERGLDLSVLIPLQGDLSIGFKPQASVPKPRKYHATNIAPVPPAGKNPVRTSKRKIAKFSLSAIIEAAIDRKAQLVAER